MDEGTVQSPADLLEHTRWLRGLARQLVSDVNTADDVVQATLVAALAWGERPREGLRNWLAGVARNVARQIGRGEKRRSWREARGAVPEALPSSGEMVELVETQRSLATAVLGLAEHYRSTIILRYFEELTPTQIARQLDIPASTVRVRLMRGLELLRERLETEYKDGDRHWSLVILPLALPPRGVALAPLWRRILGGGSGGVSAGGVLKAGLVAIAALIASAVLWQEWFSDSGGVPAVLALEGHSANVNSSSGDRARLENSGTRAVGSALAAETVDPLATDECCIVGRIFGVGGQPVEGAEVKAVGADPRAPQVLELYPQVLASPSTVTDSDGVYRLEVSPGQPYLVRVAHAGFAPAESVRSYAGERRDLVLTAGIHVTFKVVADKDNSPLSGVVVRAQSVDGLYMPSAWSVAATTDENGEARISHVPHGEIHTSAALHGYASVDLVSESLGERDLEQEFRLSPAVTINGIVLDAATDHPVVGAQVESSTGKDTTDHRGRFQIEGFDSTSDQLEGIFIMALGFAPLAEYVRIDTLGPDPLLVLRLRPPARTVGRVVDLAGVPLAGIEVGFRGRFSASPMKAERHAGRTTSDEEGRFELSLHPRAGYTIGAQGPGLPMASTWIGMPGGTRELVDVGDLVLVAGGSVRGFVRGRTFDREKPDTVEVRKKIPLGSYPARRQLLRVVGVTPDGAFSVNGLAPGEYELTLRGRPTNLEEGDTLLARCGLTVRSGEVVENVELHPKPPIRGTVRLPDGSAPAEAIVSLRARADGPSLVAVRASSDGAFEIVPGSVGPFLVTAHDPGLQFSPMTTEGVLAGARGVELQLKHRATEHEIHGRVIDLRGEPVTGVKIQFTDAVTRAIVSRVATPDARGRFSLDNLDDGPYDLRVMDYEGRYEPASKSGVRPGDEGVELLLRPHDG